LVRREIRWVFSIRKILGQKVLAQREAIDVNCRHAIILILNVLSRFVHGVRAQNNKITPAALKTVRRFQQK
jgi:hypothetical protein